MTHRDAVCVQELYSGGKDGNLLAWVPVVRTADVEEEPNGENKVQAVKNWKYHQKKEFWKLKKRLR